MFPELVDPSTPSLPLVADDPSVDSILRDVKVGLRATLHAMDRFNLYDRAVEAQIRAEIQRVDYALKRSKEGR